METLEDLHALAKDRTYVPQAPEWVPLGVTGHLTRKRGERVIIQFDTDSLVYRIGDTTFNTLLDALA